MLNPTNEKIFRLNPIPDKSIAEENPSPCSRPKINTKKNIEIFF